MEEKIMKFDDLKKGAEDALKKTVDGAKDLADKAADKTKEIAGSEVAQNIKKGTVDEIDMLRDAKLSKEKDALAIIRYAITGILG